MLENILATQGRFPPLQITITPADKNRRPFSFPNYDLPRETNTSGFINYEFESNILIPVDAFSFTFAAPNDVPVYDLIKDGDIVQLSGNNLIFSTGIIDAVEVDIDADRGVTCTIRGRDLMGQLEDQALITPGNTPLFTNQIKISTALNYLIKSGIGASGTGTRIPGFRLRNTKDLSILYGHLPGESKLSSLIRYLDALNCIVYMDPDGYIVVGKPQFNAAPNGSFYILKSERRSNVLRARVIYNSTQIPNVVLPMWNTQQVSGTALQPYNVVWNKAQRPAQLARSGNIATKVITTSQPTANDTVEINIIQNQGGGIPMLQALAARELARENMKEITVEIEVPGHYDVNGNPFVVDRMYNIAVEDASLQKLMYCYQVKYLLDPQAGQKTVMSFCLPNTIVAGAPQPGVQSR